MLGLVPQFDILNNYYEEMDRDAKQRYEEKIRMIGLTDLYYH